MNIITIGQPEPHEPALLPHSVNMRSLTTSMQGLWLHGNLLEELPTTLGALRRLRVLSVAGNCMERLPSAIGQLGVGCRWMAFNLSTVRAVLCNYLANG